MEDTMKRRLLVSVLVGEFLAVAGAAAAEVVPAYPPTLPAKETALLDRLCARIDSLDARLDGILGVAVRDLTTGATLELRPDETFPTASSIKLAVLYELYRQAAEGRIDLTEIVRPPLPRVRGSGVLQWLSGDVRLTRRDLAVLMIGWSDNEAANLLIRAVGMEAVDRRLAELGFTRTHLRRRMMDLEAARNGGENVSTPREMARLAALVAAGEALPPEKATDLLAVATVPDESSFFRSALPEGERAVSKAGTLEGVRCEAAWVDLPGRPYAAAVMTAYLRHDADGEAAIREVSAATFETFDRLARSSEYGRVISER
jgi:beta-lactamase class A